VGEVFLLRYKNIVRSEIDGSNLLYAPCTLDMFPISFDPTLEVVLIQQILTYSRIAQKSHSRLVT
jgi:hypothetical protein